MSYKVSFFRKSDDFVLSMFVQMQKVPDEKKVEQIQKLLGKIDNDKDGQLKVDDVLRIIEEIGKDTVNLTDKQVDELIDLIGKEEQIENEEKIEKALAKSIEADRQAASSEELTDESTKVLTDDAKQDDKSKVSSETKK